ncbi:hypothetical protein [Stieleria marina]
MKHDFAPGGMPGGQIALASGGRKLRYAKLALKESGRRSVIFESL